MNRRPEGKWALDVTLWLPDERLYVDIRCTRRTRQELNLAWRHAKQMASAGRLVSAVAYNSESGAVLGKTP